MSEKRVYKCSFLEGWHRQETIRQLGRSAGRCDVYYISPDGQKIRSKVELVRFVGDTVDLKHLDFRKGIFLTEQSKKKGTKCDNRLEGPTQQNGCPKRQRACPEPQTGCPEPQTGPPKRQRARPKRQRARPEPQTGCPEPQTGRPKRQRACTKRQPSSELQTRPKRRSARKKKKCSKQEKAEQMPEPFNLKPGSLEWLQVYKAMNVDRAYRYTTCIYNQPVTIYKTQVGVVKLDLTYGPQEQPTQLYWGRRLERAIPIDEKAYAEALKAIMLPGDKKPSGLPDIFDKEALKRYFMFKPNSDRIQLFWNDAFEKNPGQPLVQVDNVGVEDINRQGEQVRVHD